MSILLVGVLEVGEGVPQLNSFVTGPGHHLVLDPEYHRFNRSIGDDNNEAIEDVNNEITTDILDVFPAAVSSPSIRRGRSVHRRRGRRQTRSCRGHAFVSGRKLKNARDGLNSSMIILVPRLPIYEFLHEPSLCET